MKNNNKTLWIVVGVVIVILVVLFLVMKKPATPSEEVINEPESSEDVSEGSVSGPTAKPMSYQAAVTKYDGRRIQFNRNCEAIPFEVEYKAGTQIMIDNRSPEARTIKVGTAYNVKGYGFKIITLPSKVGNIIIDCGTHQNVATIIVK
jgi:hypothetical protein